MAQSGVGEMTNQYIAWVDGVFYISRPIVKTNGRGK
jgi:hypothetical protein